MFFCRLRFQGKRHGMAMVMDRGTYIFPINLDANANGNGNDNGNGNGNGNAIMPMSMTMIPSLIAV